MNILKETKPKKFSSRQLYIMIIKRNGKFYKQVPIVASVGSPIPHNEVVDGEDKTVYAYERKEIGYQLIEVTEKEYHEFLSND